MAPTGAEGGKPANSPVFAEICVQRPAVSRSKRLNRGKGTHRTLHIRGIHMSWDGGYVQAIEILLINLVIVAAAGGAVAATVRGLVARVGRIEDRLDRIIEHIIGGGKL